MTSKTDLRTMSKQQSRLQKLIQRAAEFLCVEGNGRQGSWGDTRTTCDAIWALCDCGVGESQQQFIRFCLDRLLSSEAVRQQHDGLCFNLEVWDTSLALIALMKSDQADFSYKITKVKKWLLHETRGTNWKGERSETLWALDALFLATSDDTLSPLVKRCVNWLLSRRNADGVLLSAHYMGFLLAVLADVSRYIRLTSREKTILDKATDKCLSYLMEEFRRSQRKAALWDNEPWSVGHVLLGLAGTPKSRGLFFNDLEFNEYLIRWYESLEWTASGGWGDLVETSFTLVGLANYYVEREAYLRDITESPKSDIRKQLAEGVVFRFEIAKVSSEMTVRPRWRGRYFGIETDECFILMPFQAGWSERVHNYLKDILGKKGFKAKRADDLMKPDAIENMWQGINEARIIIADCTDMNANVLYELGMAHTVGKDVILISQNTSVLPFDIRYLHVIRYTNDENGLIKLMQNISLSIDEILHG